MSSTKFSESVSIEAAPALIFDYTQDYHNRLEWDTFLMEARLLGHAAQAGKGVKAWCVAKNGIGMETEYVSFNRPSVAAIKMTKGPCMFRNFVASWTFRQINDETTSVTFLYSFSLRFPFNLFAFFIKRILQRNVKKRLANLKARITTTLTTGQKEY
jgi:hypothetical protein